MKHSKAKIASVITGIFHSITGCVYINATAVLLLVAPIAQAAPPDTEAPASSASPPPGPQAPSSAAAPPASDEGQQLLFLLDTSGSMTEPGFDGSDPRASRMALVQRAAPGWMSRLSADARVGLRSFGGDCGAAPAIDLPAGSDRGQVLAEIGKARPDGRTNLNAALLASPWFFSPDVHGAKRIVLLSDGFNTCPPQTSTCDIAKQLFEKHHITIDVVALAMEPRMADELSCVTKVTGGTFTAPKTVSELASIPLPSLDIWRFVVLALAILTLAFAGRVLYRHGVHVHDCGTRSSTAAATLLFALGSLFVYLVLFVGHGAIIAVLGVGTFLGVCALLATRGRAQKRSSVDLPARIAAVVLAASSLLWASGAQAAPSPPSPLAKLPTPCTKVVRPAEVIDYYIALDISDSVAPYIKEMKALVACIADMYLAPGETVSLIAFGMDEKGGVKELTTFIVPPSGSVSPLYSALEDIRLGQPGRSGAPRKTKTYYRPLGDFLNKYMQHGRHQPILLVFSDGKSDGFTDTVPFSEIPWESFGTRGIYAAPGIRGWRVAVQGGLSIDLAPLFQAPLGGVKPPPAVPVIDPCIIDPPFIAETDKELTLEPAWTDFDGTVRGVISLKVHNECVDRYRTFEIGLRRGRSVMSLDNVVDRLIVRDPQALSYPLVLQDLSRDAETAELVLTVKEGGASRRVFATPAMIRLSRVSYWSKYGTTASLIAGGAVGLVLVGLFAMARVRRARRNRPQIIKVSGGGAASLAPGQSVDFGGADTRLHIGGVADGCRLGAIRFDGIRGEAFVRPIKPNKMRLDDMDSVGGTCILGKTRVCFLLPSGSVVEVTFLVGSKRDLSFGPPTGFPLASASGFSSGSAGFGAAAIPDPGASASGPVI